MEATASMFDTLVKARAQQRYLKRISKFKEDVIKALREFMNANYCITSSTCISDKDAVKCLNALLTDWNKGYPDNIYSNIERAVIEELLRSMDEMQKAFMAAGVLVPPPSPEVEPDDLPF